MKCRFCRHELTHEFIELVNSPPSNSFLSSEELNEPEVFFPLKLFVCEKCFLVQIEEYKNSQEIFGDKYIYFSSFSKSWLDHAGRYVEMITARLGLNQESLVIEIASNDGYLLQYFAEKEIPCMGIEPAKATAEEASKKGVEVITEFFGLSLAKELAMQGRRADLLVGNNVLAHVPDINDFVHGLKIVLKDTGVITIEFPHLFQLVENNQFDTIYHEHFSYFSLFTVQKIFAAHGLEVFDVEELATHGGSLRIYAIHARGQSKGVRFKVADVLERERVAGMLELDYYRSFQDRANKVKHGLLSFLLEQKTAGKKVAGYGAAAKGNALLNYCGVKKDLMEFVVDASPYKQGKFLPGSHIPVVNERAIRKTKPDFVLILPWNIKEEIMHQLEYIRGWGGRFVVSVPQLTII
ncbi:MAG: methyltransferase domain-containing protein [Desulfobacterales bacterium]|nr:methyltransferase domain-containing protein [Desulfobacterales bacterium]